MQEHKKESNCNTSSVNSVLSIKRYVLSCTDC